jgi:hypothetical protein
MSLLQYGILTPLRSSSSSSGSFQSRTSTTLARASTNRQSAQCRSSTVTSTDTMWYVSTLPSVANKYSHLARRNMNIALSNTVSKPKWSWPPPHAARHSLRSSTVRTGAEHSLDVLVSAVSGPQVLPSSSLTLLSVYLDLVPTIKLTPSSTSSK